MKKKLLFLTSTSLATNPRLRKEIFLALENGFSTTVVSFKLGNLENLEDKILSDFTAFKDFNHYYLDATQKNKVQWFYLAILERLARFVYPLFSENLFINALASSRRSYQLFSYRYRLSKPEIIVAHNLPALYPAYILSRAFKVPFIFDIEDYHPGENVGGDIHEIERRRFLFRRILPKTRYITAASSLIAKYTNTDLKIRKDIASVLNFFPANEFVKPNLNINKNDNLSLVWFSQNINHGRGLEQLFLALQKMIDAAKKNEITLTLIGKLNDKFFTDVIEPFILKNKKNIAIHIKKPMKQQEVHQSLANYDVGLALEFGSVDLNKDICLSNKILAYAQAGLYILATDTKGQAKFINQNKDLGRLCCQNVDSLFKNLTDLVKDKKYIRKTKLDRWAESQNNNWESESSVILDMWRKTDTKSY